MIETKNNFTDLMPKSEKKLAAIFPGGIGSIKEMAEPYVGGYSYLIFTRVPMQIRQATTYQTEKVDFDAQADKDFFKLVEREFKELSGINDIDMETVSIQNGFTANEHRYPGAVQKNTNEITIKLNEMSGNLMRRPLQNWFTGIRNPETGLYNFPLAGLKNFTVEMLYVNCSPSVGSVKASTRASSLEFAAYFTGAFPTRNTLSHFNYAAASHDVAEFDIPFPVNMHTGDAIDGYAREYLGSDKFFENFIQKQNLIITDSFGMDVDNEYFTSEKDTDTNHPLKATSFENIK